MKNLKFFAMMAVVLTVFSACQKDEMVVDDPGAIASSQEKPDVYVENGYLAFKNFEVADSIRKILTNQSLQKQQLWDDQFDFKSSKTYRSEVSSKLERIEDVNTAESYVAKLVDQGYFSMKDSSITYPFYNVSWSCILNPDGVVKINNVIYLFKEDKQIFVLNGDDQLLKKFQNGEIDSENENISVRSYKRLKSVTPTSFTNITSTSREVRLNYTYKLTITLKYSPITRFDSFYQDYVQEGVTYDLYHHQQRKQYWWWIDKQTYFYHKRNNHDVGGNYDSIEGAYYTRITQTSAGSWYQLNTSKLANYHLEVYSAWHSSVPFHYPVYTNYTGPTIHNFSSSSYSAKVGNTSDPLNTIVN